MSLARADAAVDGYQARLQHWTEAGTRDPVRPVVPRLDALVSELRGWSDSDQFMAPCAGHPIQGSIFGYILRQNYPKYRDVQWGTGARLLHQSIADGILGDLAHAMEDWIGERGVDRQSDAACVAGVHHPCGHAELRRGDDDRRGMRSIVISSWDWRTAPPTGL